MSLVVVVLAVAVALGWALRGSLERLGSLPVRAPALVLAALLAQLAGALVGGPVHPVGLVVSAGLVVAFLLRNRGVRGTGLVALGLLANALVVGLNGAMPVSAAAADRAGVGLEGLLAGDARHELADAGTRLRPLGDVVPVPLPLRPEVVSPGDVLVAAGLGQLVLLGMLGVGAPDQPRVGAPDRPGEPQGRRRGALPPLPAWTSVGDPSATRPRRPPSTPPPPDGTARPSSGS